MQRCPSLRALDGDLAVAVAGELDGGIEAVMRAYVLEILLLVGGVDAKEEIVGGHFVHQNIVHEAAMLIEQPGVMRLSGLQLVDGIGGDEIRQLRGLRPADLDFAHVADVEHAHGFAHRHVL